MNQPLDPFAQNFDSIDVSATRGNAAFDQAIALAAPSAAAPEFDAPGFYLIDDADGRFIVDRDFGTVALADEALVAREHGAVYGVRLKVVERSGTSYELPMQLRIMGLAPQMVGAEDIFAAPDATPAPPSITIAPQRARVAWAAFSATQDAGGAPVSLSSCGAAPYGALVCVNLPAAQVADADLVLAAELPAPSSKSAVWSI
jgi:hypothetical protein